MRIVVFGQAVIHGPVDWSAGVREAAAGADAAICNFEGCLPPDGAWPMKRKTVHPAHRDAPSMLADLGVTHLAIANNHAWDFGHAGIVNTRAVAQAAGFAVAGAGRTLAEASAPATRNGVALIAADCGPTPDWAVAGPATPGVNPLRMTRSLGLPQADLDRMRAIAEQTGEAGLRRLRRAIGYDRPTEREEFYGLAMEAADAPAEIWRCDEGDFDRLAKGVATARQAAEKVVVALHYHHWASDWRRPPEWIVPLGRRIVEAGADAVVCTGPPFLYDMADHKGAPIAPSLGNLVFHTARGEAYDRLGHPVWEGGILVIEDEGCSLLRTDVPRLETGA
ncbi:CapA family protein [Oricola sp.]|uniref:CapA family protein n=1 Tax=Oricola sp. TaxID=1979950 RepID=UPI0025DD104F|nr:CapA family protein [Oricola sp.]MCI5074204.1 CapA family protein [Oricola sp.]